MGNPASPRTARPSLVLEDFNPRLLMAYLFSKGMQMPAGKHLDLRRVLDYEMEYILESSGSERIDDVVHPVHKGDIVFRRPGQITQGIMPYKCYTIIFELSGRILPRPDPYTLALADQASTRGWELQPNYQSRFLDVIPSLFKAGAGDIYRTLFDSVLKHYISPGEGSELLSKACILQILFQMHTEVVDPLRRQVVAPQGGSTQLLNGDGSARYRKLEAVLAYMRRNFKRKLPLQELAQIASLSPAWLHRIFSETMSETPLDHLNRLRMESARELLATSDLSASAVALECGFENVPYFFTLFKRSSGETPAQFRARHRFPV